MSKGHQTEPARNRHRRFGNVNRNRGDGSEPDKVQRFRRAGSGSQETKNRNRRFAGSGRLFQAAGGGRRRGAETGGSCQKPATKPAVWSETGQKPPIPAAFSGGQA